MTTSPSSLWVCPQCRADLPSDASTSGGHFFSLDVPGREIHDSASLENYASACPNCQLPYTAAGVKRFEYPYRQLLAKVNKRAFLTWSAAQNNGYVSYSLMRGSSCAIEGRSDVEEFADFIGDHLTSKPDVVLDLGCGPLAQPAYLPSTPDATLIGLDPFESKWGGSFIQGAAEFLPLRDGTVELVVAATSLDHTLDLERAIAEIARVTRSGGNLMIWDHVLVTRRQRLSEAFADLASGVRRRDLAKIRRAFFRERVRIYDNGIVLWTPKGYADPFHAPQSRRPSWSGKLGTTVEAAGFTRVASDATRGFIHYVRR